LFHPKTQKNFQDTFFRLLPKMMSGVTPLREDTPQNSIEGRDYWYHEYTERNINWVRSNIWISQ